MGLTFFDKNLNVLTFSNIIAPLAIIRTNSTIECPTCELTLTNDYRPALDLCYYFALSDRKQLYQIIDIETSINNKQVQYIIKGQEICSLICSRRIALEDVVLAETSNIQEIIQQQLNNYPSITDDNFYFLLTTPEGFYYTPHKIFKKDTSLLDYLFEEANINKTYVIFESEISKKLTDNKRPCVYLRAYFEKSQPVAPLFANSIYIDNMTEKQKTPTYNAFTYNANLTPALNTLSFNSLCLPSYNEGYKSSINLIMKEKPLSPQAFTLESFYRLAGFTLENNALKTSPLVADSEEETNGVVRLYVKPTCAIKIRYGITATEVATVPALIVPLCSKDALKFFIESTCYNTNVNDFFEASKNGSKNGYQALYCFNESINAWELIEDGAGVQKTTQYKGAYYYLCAIACIDNIVESGIQRVRPVNVDAFCVADNSTQNDPRYNLAYCKPLNIVAFEQRLISELPNASYKTLDISLSNKYEVNIGDELTVIIAQDKFKGVVTAVTEAWENGEDVKRDIEVNEWKQYN